MNRLRAIAPLCVAIFLMLGWAACVSDEPSTAAEDAGTAGDSSTGSEGNHCYPNNTCDPGLMCLSNVCVRLDSGSQQDSGGTNTDSGSDASVLGCNSPISTPPVGKIDCPGVGNGCQISTDAGPPVAECCVQGGVGSCIAVGGACSGSTWAAQRKTDCGQESACFHSGAQDASTCDSFGTSYCSTTGCGGDHPICVSTADCTSGTCASVLVNIGDSTEQQVIGFCQN